MQSKKRWDDQMTDFLLLPLLFAVFETKLTSLTFFLRSELYSQIKIGTGTSDTAAFKSDATFFTIGKTTGRY
jgi:hypothetical protein